MSGHSKWATIKRKKAATDSKKGKVFSQILKSITAAARESGSDPELNAKLRTILLKAREANVPQDNIKKAIQRGTGEGSAGKLESFIYEGYGPKGIALVIDIITENKNRTAAEIRHILSKYGGSLGETGCVMWMFEKKGVILVRKEIIEEEKLMELAMDNGAEDVSEEGEFYRVTSSLQDFEMLKNALANNNLELEQAEIIMESKNQIKIEEKDADTVLKIMNALEEHDDVENVYSNFDISDAIVEKLTR